MPVILDYLLLYAVENILGNRIIMLHVTRNFRLWDGPKVRHLNYGLRVCLNRHNSWPNLPLPVRMCTSFIEKIIIIGSRLFPSSVMRHRSLNLSCWYETLLHWQNNRRIIHHTQHQIRSMIGIYRFFKKLYYFTTQMCTWNYNARKLSKVYIASQFLVIQINVQ